jgi:hypothetical protein
MPLEISATLPASLPPQTSATSRTSEPAAAATPVQIPVTQQPPQETLDARAVEAAVQVDQVDLNSSVATANLDYSGDIQAARAQTGATSGGATDAANDSAAVSAEPVEIPAATAEYENNVADFARTSSGEVQPVVDSYV